MGRARQEQKIAMVTGKGGVGKSSVALALAWAKAREGKRVLLVEFGEPSYYARLLKRPVTHKPELWQTNLWVAAWDGESSLREFLLYYIRLESMVNLFFDNRAMRALIRAAPALKELALLGKLTSGIRGVGPELDFDCIVVDAFASGHFKALLDVPRGMAETVRFGPMGEQSRAMAEVLADKNHTSVFVVTIPEELPTLETKELFSELKKRRLEQVQVICNRVMDFPVGSARVEQLAEQSSASAQIDFLRYVGAWQRRQEASLSELKNTPVEITHWPFLLESDPIGLVEQLSVHAEGLWKT